MNRPSVSINIMNGQLGLTAPSQTGTTALLLLTEAAPTDGFNVPFLVKSKMEVKAAFLEPLNVKVVTAINDGFFAEAPEGTELYILCIPATQKLTDLAAADDLADKLLRFAKGKIRLVVLAKFPSDGYTPNIVNGFDSDVHLAVPLMQTIADKWFSMKKPFRFLIEGYGCTGGADTKSYEAENFRNGGIIVGELDGSSALATLLVAGRAAGIGSQQHVGRVKTGALKAKAGWALTIAGYSINNIDESKLNTFWQKRYITIENHETASGFVVTDDNMLCLPTDDYNNLRYGRVIDNAVRVAFETYYQELKDDVDVDSNGRLSIVAEKSLEAAIEIAIDTQMRSQLSKNDSGKADIKCYVNPDYASNVAMYSQNGINEEPNFNLLQTSTVYLFVKLKPKGCLKYIDVFIGYAATGV